MLLSLKRSHFLLVVIAAVVATLMCIAVFVPAAQAAVPRAKLASVTASKMGQMEVTIKAVSGAKRYQIRYSTKANFSKIRQRTSTKRKIVVKNLDAGQRYYVKARVAKKVNGKIKYGAWSTVDYQVALYKGKLASYSWAQIKDIANAISQCSSKKEALLVAKQYKLIGPAKALTGAEQKTVKLSNGQLYAVCILDFWHDDKADGTGKAGITFGFVKSIGVHRMNATRTNEGGWSSSEMRTWLNSSAVSYLPEELQSQLVPVTKLSNNTGVTKKATSVTKTEDTMWLPSVAEVLGKFGVCAKYWSWLNGATYDPIYNAEGSQYKYYSDNRAARRVGTTYMLNKLAISNGTNCWLRSADPFDSYYFAGFYKLGDVHEGWQAQRAYGVAPCFSL